MKDKLKNAVFVAHSLFERGKASGSSANISFLHEGLVYISKSGTCFGTLRENEFAAVPLNGAVPPGENPSKELPLHLQLYQKSGDIQAVLHTHSHYATLWSCLEHENTRDCIPRYTPYLKMKLGSVGLVPYAEPGSAELFAAFANCVMHSDGFLLANHGPLVGSSGILEAFYALEELEESARIAFALEGSRRGVNRI